MSGTNIRAIPKQTFDFSNLAPSATAEYLMVKSLDVAQWTTVWLWLRVHSNGIVPDNAQIQIIVNPTAPSVEDPAVDFVDTGSFTALGFNKAFGAPKLIGVDISSLSNGFVRISVKGVQDSSAGVMTADISVDIVAKAKG
jgi:hypothetical protein